MNFRFEISLEDLSHKREKNIIFEIQIWYNKKDEIFEVNNDKIDKSEGINDIKKAIDARIDNLLENGECDQAVKELDGFIEI